MLKTLKRANQNPWGLIKSGVWFAEGESMTEILTLGIQRGGPLIGIRGLGGHACGGYLIFWLLRHRTPFPFGEI